MKAIVCVDENWAIGREGKLLFRISEDLKRFKHLTMGKGVILGRKTLETFPGGRPLAGRENLILSRDRSFQVPGGTVYGSIEALLEGIRGETWVIGGETVYRELLGYCDEVYVTKVQAACPDADAWFPNLDKLPEWRVAEESENREEKGLVFRYVTYERI